MHSLRKTLFHVIGIFCLLITGALWYAAMSDVKFLNESLGKLANLKIAGYGLDITDQDERLFTVALAGSGPGVYLTLSLFVIGWMEGSARALKWFFTLTGSLLGLLFCGLWFKFLVDDHIVANSEKMELFGISTFLGVGTIVLCWMGLRKSSDRFKHDAMIQADVLSAEPRFVQEAPKASTGKTDIPSVESLLGDEDAADPSEGEERESSSDDGEEGGLAADGEDNFSSPAATEDDALSPISEEEHTPPADEEEAPPSDDATEEMPSLPVPDAEDALPSVDDEVAPPADAASEEMPSLPLPDAEEALPPVDDEVAPPPVVTEEETPPPLPPPID